MQQLIIDLLLELKDASQLITDDNDYQLIIRKYNMLFLGEKFNSIYSHELSEYLSKTNNIDIKIEELNSLIPDVCKMLDMKFEPLYTLSQPSKVHTYEITLWE